MNTPLQDIEKTSPNVLTEAQIQGAYMFACQELSPDIINRKLIPEDLSIPAAIGISNMDLKDPRHSNILPIIRAQRDRLFACM